MTNSNEQTLVSRPIDLVTSVVKGAIGAVPIAGPLLAEIAGTLIPNQRVDRLAKYAETLGERLASIEETTLRALLTNENFTDAAPCANMT